MRKKSKLTISTALVLVFCFGLTACTAGPTPIPSTANVEPSGTPTAVDVVVGAAGDPMPKLKAAVHVFDASGGQVEDVGVALLVPPGATTGKLEARFGEGAGILDTGLATERFGPPIQVQHAEELVRPLTVTWDVSQLGETELATIGLARWDPDLEMWTPTQEGFTVSDGTLTTDISEFSILTWITNAAAWTTQFAGEVSGKRATAPTCKAGSLPLWVRNVVRPDEDQPGMPIRTCVEARVSDILGLRIVNNRPYTQALTLSEDATASSTRIDEDFTIVGIVYHATSSALSQGKTVVIPPTHTSDIELARPSAPGPISRNLSAQPSAIGVGVDVLVYVLENSLNLDAVGGFDSQLLNETVQLIYDCGGKKLLETRDYAIDPSLVGKVTEVMAQCASSDKVALLIERFLRKQISKGGKTAEQAIKSARVMKQTLGALRVVTVVADFSSYTAELITGAELGPVTIGVFGRGKPQILGSWTPTCTDANKDSGLLYTNLSTQDEFASTNKDFWEFDGWQLGAIVAVKPLTACPADHQMDVAVNVDETWGDKKSAAVVSAQIRAQIKGDDVTIPGLPQELRGRWCTRSDREKCFDGIETLANYPEAFVYDAYDDDVLGSTFYTLCLSPDLGEDGCTVAMSMYLEYFPPGVDWDCPRWKVATGDFPACDPDFTSAHDASLPRLVIPLNHQHNVNYVDTEPMYLLGS